MLALTLGGHIAQDISETGGGKKVTIKHSQKGAMSTPSHMVNIDKSSILYSLYGAEKIAVNSLHHQVVDKTTTEQ